MIQSSIWLGCVGSLQACFYFEPRIDVDDLSPGQSFWRVQKSWTGQHLNSTASFECEETSWISLKQQRIPHQTASSNLLILQLEGEMSWFLAAFRGNAVHGCSTALLMPTLRNGDSKAPQSGSVDGPSVRQKTSWYGTYPVEPSVFIQTIPTDARFCPSNISFMDHFSDSCENVRSTFCPVGLRCWQTQVFEEFTVFASDYVAFIHACDRCRFLNWKWVECTYGIMDQDRDVGTHFNGTARKTKEWTEGKDKMDLKIPPVARGLAKTHKLWLG